MMAMRDAKASPKGEELAFAVIGAAINVHRELGPGYLETVYESINLRTLRAFVVQKIRRNT